VLLRELGVFGFGLLEDWDVGVGIFPEGEKILVGGAGFRGVTGQGVGAGEFEMSQGADEAIADQPAMVEDFLKFGGRGGSLFRL